MRSPILLLLSVHSFVAANAQMSTQGPAVRDLPAPASVSAGTFGAISGVRGLPGGRALVNDATNHRLILLDSTLQVQAIVLDSSVGHSYGQRQGGLLRYLGDSSLFIDAASLSGLLIDGSGKVVRQLAVPSRLMQNIIAPTHQAQGYPDVDAKGRILFRAPVTGQVRPGTIEQARYDSMFIGRLDLTTHVQDTIATLHLSRATVSVPTASGRGPPRLLVDPIPFSDDWAVLTEGSLAIVRAHEYRLELVGPDGSHQTSPPISFPWRRVDDAEKQHLIDSASHAEAVAAANAYYCQVVGWANSNGMPYPKGFSIPPDVRCSPLPAGWVLPPATPSPQPVGADPPPPPPQPGPGEPREVLPVNQLADYRPPFAAGGVRADADNHVWIRTLAGLPTEQGVVYDIIDRTGQIVARIRVRLGQVVVGFGPGNRVYLATQDPTGVHLAAAVWR